MLSLQEISDRLEIQDLLARYSHAVDQRDWAALSQVFTPDAIIDYTEMGGARGTLPEIQVWLAEALSRFKMFQHMVGTSLLTIDGDTARARTLCHNPMVITRDGNDHVFFCGLWYRDELVRTPDGWRICSRHEEHGYFHNVPPGLEPAPALASSALERI